MNLKFRRAKASRDRSSQVGTGQVRNFLEAKHLGAQICWTQTFFKLKMFLEPNFSGLKLFASIPDCGQEGYWSFGQCQKFCSFFMAPLSTAAAP